MRDATKRALRSFFQGFVGVALLFQGVLTNVSETGLADWAVLSKLGLAAVAGGIIGLLSWAQNAQRKRASSNQS